MTNPNDPAFPIDAHVSKMGQGVCPGLTKREYFAAMSLKGLRSSALPVEDEFTIHSLAVKDADNLIKELNK